MKKSMYIKMECEIKEGVNSIERLMELDDNYLIADMEGNFYMENCDDVSELYPVSKEVVEEFIQYAKEYYKDNTEFTCQGKSWDGSKVINNWIDKLERFLNGEVDRVDVCL